MKKIKDIIIFFAVLLGVNACDEVYEPYIPKGRIEKISFEQDTFVFNESIGTAEVVIIASKYVNYATQISVEIQEETAIEDSNFVVLTKNVEIELGEQETAVPLKIIDDTLINVNRIFKMSITSIEGGGEANLEGQTCVVILANNDYEARSSIVFEQPTDTVREDAATLKIPFKLTMPAEGDVSVTFAHIPVNQQGVTEAAMGEHFRFKDGNSTFTLSKGELSGILELDVVNNITAHGNVGFKLVARTVEGALIGVDSTCHVTIIEDDLDRVITFNNEEMVFEEGNKVIEVPLYFSGGKSADRLMSGAIVIDSIFGCSEDDIVLQTTTFRGVSGDTTINVKVELKDNAEFGESGFLLTFGELENVRASAKGLINIKDDERILGFDTARIEINEGVTANIPYRLFGGDVADNMITTVEVVSEGTTADDGQYEFAKNGVLYGETDNSSLSFKTIANGQILGDREVVLKITATSYAELDKILYNQTQYCTVVIKNMDISVGFLNTDYSVWMNDTLIVPIKVVGEPNATSLITLKAKEASMTGVSYKVIVGDRVFSQGEDISVPFTNSGLTNIKVKFTEIEDVTLDNIPEFEIVNLFGTPFTASNIDSDNSNCAFRVVAGYKQLTVKDILVSSSANSHDASFQAAKAVDGDKGTMWHAAWADGQFGERKPPYYLNYELDDIYIINQMEMFGRPGEDYITRVKGALIEGSLDGETWFTLFDFKSDFSNDNSSGKIKHKELTRAKYFKVTLPPALTHDHAAIMEIYLWTVEGLGIE